MPYFKSNKWLKLFHNAKFEQKFTQYFYNTAIRNLWDAFLAEQVLYPDSHDSKSLEALALKYENIQLNKETRKSFFNQKSNEFTQAQIEYAAQDVQVLFGIMKQQKEKAEELGLTKILKLEFELAGVVADMELTGAPVKADMWSAKLKEFEIKHEESRLKLNDMFYDTGKMDEQLGLFARTSINLNSPKQVKDTFEKAFGIKLKSTDEREIGLLNHDAARELLKYRGYQKTLTSYGQASFIDKIHPFTGRFHADFQQVGTGTGRFSCREPNMQQIPEAFHECIQAEGYLLCTADYSQIELRILAQLSDDPNLIKAFNSGDDLHKATASLMFGVTVEKVTKEQRFMAKTINFGISYGMQLKKLRDTLNKELVATKGKLLTYSQVQDLMNRHDRTYRVAKEWLAQAGNRAYIQGYSETMSGRKRFYTRPDQQNLDTREFEAQVAAIKRQGANSPIQGTNADITKMAMIRVYDEIQDAGYRANIILQVHDEIVILAQKNQAEEVKVLLEETMIDIAAQVITKVPIKVDARVSNFWQK